MMKVELNDLIGKQFESGGRGPDKYDCWGLAREVYRRYGIELPDYSIPADACDRVDNQVSIEASSGRWKRLETPQVPCVVLLKCHPVFVQHIGVYIGSGKFIHMLDRKKGAVVSRLDSPMWANKIKGFWAYVG